MGITQCMRASDPRVASFAVDFRARSQLGGRFVRSWRHMGNDGREAGLYLENPLHTFSGGWAASVFILGFFR